MNIMTNNISDKIAEQLATNPIIPVEKIARDESFDRLMHHAELMLAGGTEEMGRTVASAILKRINNGVPLSHSLIMQAEKARGNSLVVADIPINRGILEGFGMSPDDHERIAGNTVISLGETGLSALMQPLWYPRNELTEAETVGLRHRIIDENGNYIDEEGVTVLPTFALRAVIQNVMVNDPELTIG
jgi:hypothetical protein